MPNLTITQMLCPKSKYDIKCPFNMTPEGLTVHNTYNDASAMNEISYMISNNHQVSFHYAVDDYRAVQGILETRNAWHASDGAYGTGNRETIAMEICYSKSGGPKFTKAEANAAVLAAMLCKKYGWTTSNIKRHYDYAVDKKYCPHRTMDLGWERWLNKVKELLNETIEIPSEPTKPTTPSGSKRKVGDVVSFIGLATSSSASSYTTNILTKSGKITRIVSGANYPYLINGGTGWVNDDLIDGNASESDSSASDDTIKVGSTVKINGIYTSSTSTVKLTPAKSSGKVTKILNGATNPYLLDNGNLGWTNDSCIISNSPSTSGGGSSSSKTIKVGSVVTINGIYSSSTSTKVLTPSKSTGTVTKILSGARNPYLLDNGNLGWVDKAHIVSNKTSTSSSSSKTIKVGSVVTINGIYTSSTSTKVLTPAKSTGTVTKIMSGVRNPYLLDNGNLGWVDKAHIVKVK